MVKLRNIFFILFILFLPLFFAEAEGKIVEVEIGKIPRGKIKKTFEFKRVIKDAFTTCECASAKVYKKEVSGEVIYAVVVTLNLRSYIGNVHKDIYLLEEDDTVTKLRIRALVERD